MNFFIGFSAGLVLNAAFLVLGRRTKLLRARQPDGTAGVSKMGGPALVLSAFITAGACLFGQGAFAQRELLLWAGLSGAFFLGWADDLLDFSPHQKLFFQTLIAAFLVSGGIRTQIVFLPEPANVLLSVLWFVVLMNAFNFLDILDGLAAGIAVFCAAGFFCIAALTKNAAALAWAMALLAANLSFLPFNLAPARLYMGDMGSLFNGCALAAIAILISYAPAGREVALFVPLFILALPLYDLVFVLFVRWKRGRPLTKKSRDHFVLRLVDRGSSPKKAVRLMVIFNIFFNIAALLLFKASNAVGAALLAAALFGWLFFAYRVSRSGGGARP